MIIQNVSLISDVGVVKDASPLIYFDI